MIPKIIHQMWVGPPLPETFKRWTEEWKALHPDWEFIMWGQERDLPPLRNQDIYDRAGELCRGYEGQLRADVARYELLYRFGGVWLDVDFEPLKPIDGLLEGVECFTAWEIQDTYANNAIFGCVPGHPFLKDLIDGLPASIAAHPNMGPWKISGPRYMTLVLERHPEVKVFDQKVFYPIGCREIAKLGSRKHYGDAWAVHFWNNTHRKKGKRL